MAHRTRLSAASRAYASLSLCSLMLSGCITHYASRYAPSSENFVRIQTAGRFVANVGPFTTAKGVAINEVQCAATTIAPPDDDSFAEYIKKALVSELQLAKAYSASGPTTITGEIETIELTGSALSATSQWALKVSISGNGKTFEVYEKYTFPSFNLNTTQCEMSMRRLPDAVQNLVGKIVGSPEFADLVQARRTSPTTSESNSALPSGSTPNAVAQKLRDLQALRKDGVLTEEEYQSKKKQLLEML